MNDVDSEHSDLVISLIAVLVELSVWSTCFSIYVMFGAINNIPEMRLSLGPKGSGALKELAIDEMCEPLNLCFEAQKS